jgi:predicted restriction endonuclease
MKTLDLHGDSHESVEQKVHTFVFNNELPVKIVTGKSEAMRKIVLDTVSTLGYHSHYERLINEGSLIITEQEF